MSPIYAVAFYLVTIFITGFVLAKSPALGAACGLVALGTTVILAVTRIRHPLEAILLLLALFLAIFVTATTANLYFFPVIGGAFAPLAIFFLMGGALYCWFQGGKGE